ncbi:hypothetical protein GH714_040187 [Hevea brasiliensis]|uniref:Uncharacterized protein n=1 Tax=Hevea brasiliensis TaxID=3981 RepID=A0A6A6MR15_HEVBR|nr:hypothetical protein GH714_040187 [Hevea brasiliensis]
MICIEEPWGGRQICTIPNQGIDELQHELPKGIWLRFDLIINYLDLPTLYLQGQAKGVLFEDYGDGYEFTKGAYLFTRYVAELQSSIVIVFLKQKGLGRGPKDVCTCNCCLAEVDSRGMDGDVVQIIMPLENDVSELAATSKQQYRSRLESSKHIPDVEEISRPRGGELSKIPIELKSGD